MAPFTAPNAGVYSKLHDPKDIRLLIIQPDSSTERLSCELTVHRLDEDSTREYEALSWCWGDSQDLVKINILQNIGTQGPLRSIFTIRKTLHQALCALRHESKPRVMWADAICINQHDADERGLQVARMSELYSRAKNVCIWLGGPTANSSLALNFVRDELSRPYQLNIHVENDWIPHWAALRDLMKRPWFSRRWIVQEVALATHATVHCGDDCVTWAQFKNAVSIMVQSKGTLERLMALAKAGSALKSREMDLVEVLTLGAAKLAHVSDRLFKRDAGQVLHRTSALETLVAWLPMFESGEPRDVVYALLALAKDTSPMRDSIPDIVNGVRLKASQRKALMRIRRLFPQRSVENFPILYEEPVLDVYQRFTMFAINRCDPSRALDIICRPFAMRYKWKEDTSADLPDPASNRDAYTLPSWLPDIDTHTSFQKKKQPDHGDGKEATYKYVRLRGDLFVSIPETVSHYRAADNKVYDPSKLEFRRRRDHYSMFAEGFVLDEIDEVLSTSEANIIPASWIKLSCSADVKPEAFVRTLLADRGPEGHAPAFYATTLTASLKYHQEAGSHLSLAQEATETDSSLVEEVMTHIGNTVTGRKLIRTRHQGLLGLAPDAAQPNDKICILYGCSVPVILRRHSKPKNTEQDKEDDQKVKAQKADQFKAYLYLWMDNHPEIKSRMQALLHEARLRASGGVSAWARWRASMIDADFLLKGVLFCCFIVIIIRQLEEPILGCLLAILGFSHYAHEVVHGRHRHAKQNQIIYLAPFALAPAAFGHHPFLGAAGIWIVTISLYPQLLPQRWHKKLQDMLVRNSRWIRNSFTPPAKKQDQATREGNEPDKNYKRHVEEVGKYAFSLIGESYIDGMMSGEAIKVQNDSAGHHDRLCPVVFEIR